MTKRICLVFIWIGLCITAARSASKKTFNTASSQANPTAVSAVQRDYHNQPRVIEQFNHRNPDGSYEFRYELSDGNTRYERGYFVNRNNAPSLVVTGYYAYRLDDGRYTTIFYNADDKGYRQQASTSSQRWPDLPRTIDVTTENGNFLRKLARASTTLLPEEIENVNSL